MARSVSNNEVIELIMREAQRRGLDWFQPQHAYGMAGSFFQESGGFRDDVIDFKRRGDNGTAYGLMQWRGPRYQNLLKFADRSGQAANDIRTQISFAFEEGMRGSPYVDGGSVKAFNQMQQARDANEAAIAFIHAERPAGYDGNANNAHDANLRVQHAQKLMTGHSGQAPSDMNEFDNRYRPSNDTNTFTNSSNYANMGQSYDNNDPLFGTPGMRRRSNVPNILDNPMNFASNFSNDFGLDLNQGFGIADFQKMTKQTIDSNPFFAGAETDFSVRRT